MVAAHIGVAAGVLKDRMPDPTTPERSSSTDSTKPLTPIQWLRHTGYQIPQETRDSCGIFHFRELEHSFAQGWGAPGLGAFMTARRPPGLLAGWA